MRHVPSVDLYRKELFDGNKKEHFLQDKRQKVEVYRQPWKDYLLCPDDLLVEDGSLFLNKKM